MTDKLIIFDTTMRDGEQSPGVVMHGARQVECTINGLGERAGNAVPEEIVMAVQTRGDYFPCTTDLDTTEIVNCSKLVLNVTGFPVQPNKAVVGANAVVKFKEPADKKHEIYDEELQAIVTDNMLGEEEMIKLVSLKVVMETGETPTAELTLSIDGEETPGRSEGDGPADAINRAYSISSKIHPQV